MPLCTPDLQTCVLIPAVVLATSALVQTPRDALSAELAVRKPTVKQVGQVSVCCWVRGNILQLVVDKKYLLYYLHRFTTSAFAPVLMTLTSVFAIPVWAGVLWPPSTCYRFLLWPLVYDSCLCLSLLIWPLVYDFVSAIKNQAADLLLFPLESGFTVVLCGPSPATVGPLRFSSIQVLLTGLKQTSKEHHDVEIIKTQSHMNA